MAMSSTLRHKSVPGVVALCLCCMSFFAGRFVQNGRLLGSSSELVSAPRLAHRKLSTNSDIRETDLDGTVAPATLRHTLPIDPLDPVQIERFVIESSGLLQKRPPLPSGASGDDFYHAIPFQILSWYPRIIVFPAFLDKARCEAIIALAKKHMRPSGLAYKPGEKVPEVQDTRTSTGTFLSSSMDTEGVLAWVEERLAAATMIPRGYGEAFNVLKYENMQHYDSHYDTFDPKDFGPQSSQRIATVLLYLSEVEAGGETVFKREGKGKADRSIEDWRNCDDGSFKYTPRQGDAVLFYGTKPNGDIDAHALHGGCPVKAGEKWVATKWLRSKGMDL